MASVVLDPQQGMTEPPQMLHRPADAPPTLEPVSGLAPVQAFRHEFAAQLQMHHSRRLGSLRATTRAWAGRVSGRADRRLLFRLSEALDAVVVQVDSLTDHVTSLEMLTADIASAYGEDLTRLRAEIAGVRRQTGRLGEDPRG